MRKHLARDDVAQMARSLPTHDYRLVSCLLPHAKGVFAGRVSSCAMGGGWTLPRVRSDEMPALSSTASRLIAVPAGWEDSRAYPAGCLRSLEYAHEFIGYVHLCKTMRGIRMPRAI